MILTQITWDMVDLESMMLEAAYLSSLWFLENCVIDEAGIALY